MNLPKHKNWIKKLGSLKSYSYELTELNNENRYLFASKFDDGINPRFYDEYEAFAEFSNHKDLFDLICYLTRDPNDKRYKEALKNEKLYEYFI